MLATQLSIRDLWTKIGSKAAHTALDCDLRDFSLSDLIELLGDGRCAYTGEGFENGGDITFERVNPKQGYVKGNVLLVSRKSNQHKSQLDAFVHGNSIPAAMKIKLLRKALYQIEKQVRKSNG